MAWMLLIAAIATTILAIVFVVAMLVKREHGGGPLAITSLILLGTALAFDIMAGLLFQ